MAAIEEENAGLVFKILRGGQIDFDCDAFEENHPLLKAVELGNLSIVRLLVEYGANYNSTDDYNGENGITAFEMAVEEDYKEIVDYFLTFNPSESEIVEASYYASRNQDIHDSFVSRITDVNGKYGEYGSTLLIQAAMRVDAFPENDQACIQTIQKLLDLGARKEITDNDGETAYDMIEGEHSVVRSMLAITDQETPNPVATNPNYESSLPKTPQPPDQVEKLGCLLGGACYLIPLLGLVLYLSWKDTFPAKAKSAAIWASVGLAVGIWFWNTVFE